MWLWLAALVVVKITQWFYRWSNPNCNGKLPPGSMGFPIIGETIEFFRPYDFNEIPPFIKKRMSRYGPLFRTNILGSNTVVSTDPEVNFEIFRQENKSFVLSYPEAFVKMFGRDNLFFKQGNFHKYIKQITQHFFGTESLKRRMIHDMDRATREHLESMAKEGVFAVKDSVAALIQGHLTPRLISDMKPETKSRLMEDFRAFNFNWFGLSLSLSTWKALRRALSARGNAIQEIKDTLKSRKASKQNCDDFLGTLFTELEKEGTILNEETAVLLTFGMLLVSHDTTSSAAALAVKFISENSKALGELKKEHETILRDRVDKECGISWDEYRTKMSFTHMVINETLRLGTLAPTMFRRAVRDVEVKGYTIPAGWIVMVAPSIVHFDGEIYENPLEFNPWRWEGKELLSGSKTFMAFGGGARLCPGAEFARLQIAIFLHYLVTKYSFSVDDEGEITRAPTLRFTKKIRAKISKSYE